MATSVFLGPYNQLLNTSSAVEFADVTVDGLVKQFAFVDTANNNERALAIQPVTGTIPELVIAGAFTDGDTWEGLRAYYDISTHSALIKTSVDGGASATVLQLTSGSGGLTLTTTGVLLLSATNGVSLGASGALGPNTTTASTTVLRAYDVDGAAYKTFVTLTNANVPTCNISQPAGAILAFVPPAADPHVVGALWNNAGTLTISAG